MSDFEFDLPMPKQQKKLLLDIVRLAREYNVLSVPYSSSLVRGAKLKKDGQQAGIQEGFAPK